VIKQIELPLHSCLFLLITHMITDRIELHSVLLPLRIIFYCIDTDEIPGFLLLLKNHIFIARSEDTIFIFHV